MKRIHTAIAATLIATLCAAAHATPPGNNGGGNGPCGVGQQTNGCGTAGNTTNSPTANAGAIAGAAAQSNAAAIALAAQHQAQIQVQEQRQSAAATGGAAQSAAHAGGGAGGLGGDAQGGSLNVSGAGIGNTVFERSAPGVNVGAQTQPIVDCRRTLGLGASSTGGSGVASGIPLWKEGDCAAAMALDAQIKAGTAAFGTADRQHVACKIEANEDAPTCKKLKSDQRAANEAMRANVATGPAATVMP